MNETSPSGPMPEPGGLPARHPLDDPGALLHRAQGAELHAAELEFKVRNLEEQLEALQAAAKEVASRAQQMPVQLSDERGATMGFSTYSAVETSVMERLIAALNASNPASEPPVSSRGGLPSVSSSGPPAPNQESKP